MAYWLLKTEPSTFSFATLTKNKRTVWDGVTNATALIHIRRMKKGDLALIYHTGDERQAVGIARITTDAFPDPKLHDPKLAVVEIEAVEPLPKPVTLERMKTMKALADCELLRISRLSVVPLTEKHWQAVVRSGR